MPRPTCRRKIFFKLSFTSFHPAGAEIIPAGEVIMGCDEAEAVRLKHLLKMDQEEAAEQMGLSQPTFHRLLASAHEKMTEAIINGKVLRITGGNIAVHDDMQPPPCGRRRRCRRGWSAMEKGQVLAENILIEKGVNMKIAVTSVDGTMEGMVDERFGRCRNLVIYDSESKQVEVLENGVNTNLAQGAGIQTAQNVVRAGVKSVIGGHFGPKAFKVLHTAGIDVFTASGMKVDEAIKSFEQGSLKKLEDADTEAHW